MSSNISNTDYTIENVSKMKRTGAGALAPKINKNGILKSNKVTKQTPKHESNNESTNVNKHFRWLFFAAKELRFPISCCFVLFVFL